MPLRQYDCSLIIPTHNRCEVLDATLSRIESLSDRICDFEVIVVDNGSTDGTIRLAERHRQARWIELGVNMGAAARNVGATAARGRILLMLDDDSWPMDGTLDGLVELFDRRPDLGAVACRVRLAEPPHRHDAGGVPGIFFNCGGAVRREAFLEAGGYPIDFDYYVEEYDLCCRLWQNGWRVEPHGDLLVWHGRVTKNRDNNRMLRLLVRNNLRLWSRYAPASELVNCLEMTVERYRRVAEKEHAVAGFQAGLAEGRTELAAKAGRRQPLSEEQYQSLFGLAAARDTLREWADNHQVRAVAVWSRGKGCEQLLALLRSVGIRVKAVYDRAVNGHSWCGAPLRSEDDFNASEVDGIVVGSLSPGVAEDVAEELRERVRGVPVLSPSPWARQETQYLAIPA
jgi:GT2 family glycosyltransferase